MHSVEGPRLADCRVGVHLREVISRLSLRFGRTGDTTVYECVTSRLFRSVRGAPHTDIDVRVHSHVPARIDRAVRCGSPRVEP
jgi:hypothetical protein